MQFSKTTYIVIFVEAKKPNVVLHGIEALARFASNDLYRVEGLNGRQLTEAELDAWESLTDQIFDVVTLPRGFGHA